MYVGNEKLQSAILLRLSHQVRGLGVVVALAVKATKAGTMCLSQLVILGIEFSVLLSFCITNNLGVVE